MAAKVFKKVSARRRSGEDSRSGVLQDRRLNYRRLGSRRFFFPARGWHHHRCAIDFSFAKRELKWKAQKGFNPV
jgi:hypothetical protein